MKEKKKKNAAAKFRKDTCTTMSLTALFTVAMLSVHELVYG